MVEGLILTSKLTTEADAQYSYRMFRPFDFRSIKLCLCVC